MNLRTVAGIIKGFTALMMVIIVGGIVFYNILGAIDSSSFPPAWQALYNSLDTVFGIGVGIYVFVLLFLMFTPLLWIFLGKIQKGDNYR